VFCWAAPQFAPAFGEQPSVPPPFGQDPPWFLAQVDLPQGLNPPPRKAPVVVAIVDDAIRTSHRLLDPFIWRNPGERVNGVDDDGNGVTDDIQGWDVSDADNDVNPPPGKEETYYHGTHLAGIIAQMAQMAYGEKAPEQLRIMPVKVLSDWAENTYLKDSYGGLKYALDAGADIILCAWNEADLKPELRALLQEAEKRSVIIVGSAGNYPEEKEQFPAAFPAVIAVAGSHVSGAKMAGSNYGSFVDMVAPGEEVSSSGATSDTAYRERTGTSMSAAIVAGAVALLKNQYPDLSPHQIRACLENTATPVDDLIPEYMRGKLGAGRLNVKAAIEYPQHWGADGLESVSSHHRGYLVRDPSEATPASWILRPLGEIEGFWFYPRSVHGAASGSHLRFYADMSPNGEPHAQYPLTELPVRIDVPGRTARVVLDTESGARPDFLIEYRSKTINFRTRYCTDNPVAEITSEGVVEDGSGDNPYAPLCSCKWLITAPPGKVIRINFLQFDTEARVDWVYFFNGNTTQQQQLMARFSGPDIPPQLTTWGNQALLWFVSDERNEGRGWKARISFRDTEGGS